jgi:hypothetical protein
MSREKGGKQMKEGKKGGGRRRESPSDFSG